LSLRCGGGKEKEEELKKKGWARQFVTDEPRLSEAVELYRELGYEVHLEDATMDEVNQICANCLPADCNNYKIIFIRKTP
jgi:methyl coenzyme M reductase subunit D